MLADIRRAKRHLHTNTESRYGDVFKTVPSCRVGSCRVGAASSCVSAYSLTAFGCVHPGHPCHVTRTICIGQICRPSVSSVFGLGPSAAGPSLTRRDPTRSNSIDTSWNTLVFCQGSRKMELHSRALRGRRRTAPHKCDARCPDGRLTTQNNAETLVLYAGATIHG